MERITSRQNPLITRLRRLGAEKKARRAQGVFLCEGVKLVGRPCAGAAAGAAGGGGGNRPPGGAARRGAGGGGAGGAAAGGVHRGDPQGMLAVCRTPDTAPPEALPEGRLLVLDGVQDPGNVGTVWRTADAFGAAGLFLLPGCAEPFAPRRCAPPWGLLPPAGVGGDAGGADRPAGPVGRPCMPPPCGTTRRTSAPSRWRAPPWSSAARGGGCPSRCWTPAGRL